MADRIVILDAGRAAQIGTPEEIYNRPNSPFVASFMGAGNVVPLELRGAGERVAIAAGPFSDAIEVDAALLADSAHRQSRLRDAPVNAHFRSEDARLCPPEEAGRRRASSCAARSCSAPIPAGSIATRCASGRTNTWWTMMRRVCGRRAVGIALPATALHLYAAPGGETAIHAKGGGHARVASSSRRGGDARHGRRPRAQQKVTLNVVTAGDQNMVDYVKDYLGPMFEKDHPGVTVKAVGTGPGDAGSQKIYEKLDAEKANAELGHRRRRHPPEGGRRDGEEGAARALCARGARPTSS